MNALSEKNLSGTVRKKDLRDLTRHLQALVRIDTSAPEQNETEAALYLKSVFDKEGIKSRILEAAPGRGNIVARLKGSGKGRPLLLMSHLDVVPASMDDGWLHHPFKAKIDNGYIYGRGTLDCKNSTALWLMVMILIKRSGIHLDRDIIFCATADEETGHKDGIKWLVDNHFDLIDAEAALNEGGGFALPLSGKIYFPIQNAEKGNLWTRITARGTAGHGSVPRRDNPVIQISRFIQRVSRQKFPLMLTDTVYEMFRSMRRESSSLVSAALWLMTRSLFSDILLSTRLTNEEFNGSIRAMLRNTISPNAIFAPSEANVIPSEASALVDLRVLPGYSIKRGMQLIQKLAGPDLEIEVLDAQEATVSPINSMLTACIERSISLHAPHARTMPFLLTGVSDACFLRPKGIQVYGFTPLLEIDDISLTHGVNERISLASLEFGLRVSLDIISQYVRIT
jgi:acetylornithine deacetylase/succinyl-diaminopimelate desuccinylase-like protein